MQWNGTNHFNLEKITKTKFLANTEKFSELIYDLTNSEQNKLKKQSHLQITTKGVNKQNPSNYFLTAQYNENYTITNRINTCPNASIKTFMSK